MLMVNARATMVDMRNMIKVMEMKDVWGKQNHNRRFNDQTKANTEEAIDNIYKQRKGNNETK